MVETGQTRYRYGSIGSFAREVNGTVNRIVAAAAAVVLLLLLGYWLRVSLASDATRIRWLVEDMKESFNSSSARGVVGGLSKDFVDESTRAERIDIHQFLIYFFQKERDPTTKEFKYHVDIEQPEITVEPEGRKASVRIQADFRVRRGEERPSIWQVEIQGQLENDDEEGWLIVRASHRTIAGKRPF
jgi:hypothetical protein